MKLLSARSGSFATSSSALKLCVWHARQRSSSARVPFVKEIRRSSFLRTRSPRASVSTFQTPRQINSTESSRTSPMRTLCSRTTTIRSDLSSEKLKISLTKQGQRLIRRSSLSTNFKTNSQTKRVKVWLTWARSCRVIAWRNTSSSVRPKSRTSVSLIYPDCLRTKMSQCLSWKRRQPSLKAKCIEFKRNIVKRTTRDKESSFVSASTTQTLKLGSIRWVVPRIKKEEKVVAGKELLVSSSRPPRSPRPIHEDWMMKMLIEASKFLKELRWKTKLLKSLVEPIGQQMLS